MSKENRMTRNKMQEIKKDQKETWIREPSKVKKKDRKKNKNNKADSKKERETERANRRKGQ